jgi:hypothetical protein
MCNLSKFLLASVVLGFLMGSGCAQSHFEQPTEGIRKVDPGLPPPIERPSCELPEVDYQLDSQVLAFEAIKSRKLKFGFNLLNGWIGHFGVGFKVKQALLVLRTDLREFLKPTQGFAPAEGESPLLEKELNFEIDIGRISAGTDAYNKTPFYDMMKRALRDSLERTMNQARKVDPLWSSVIVDEALQDQYVIPAGANAGIQVGDEFAVYNVKHLWSEGPCTSEYRMRQNTTTSAIATLVVEDSFQLAPNSAILSIKERHLPDEIELGAYVYLKKLAGSRTTSLKKSVIIRDLKPFLIPYETADGKQVSVNLTQDLENALSLIAPEKGLYIKKVKD